MLGKRFGKLTVQEKIAKSPSVKRDGIYRCLCDCGNTCEARATSLRKGDKKSCGCLAAIFSSSPWVGKKVGQLLVLERLPGKKYRCLCDCGSEVISTSMWSRSRTLDANCRGPAHHKKKDVTEKLVVKRKKDHYLYCTWIGMKTRCLSPTARDYRMYGGRGIKIHDTWVQDFWAYTGYIDSELGLRPSDEHTLDRKNNDGNYEPGNMRWATPIQQSRNKTNNLATEYGGVTYTTRAEAYLKWCSDGRPDGAVFSIARERMALIQKKAKELKEFKRQERIVLREEALENKKSIELEKERDMIAKRAYELTIKSKTLAEVAIAHNLSVVRTTDDALLSLASGESVHYKNLFFFNKVWNRPTGLWIKKKDGGKRVLMLNINQTP